MLMKVIIRAVLFVLYSALFAIHCANADTPKHIDIAAGDLSQALLEFSKQYGVDLVYRPEQVYGLKTQGAHGDLNTEQAVKQLLQGTPLRLRTDSSGAMLIVPPTAETTPNAGDSKASNVARDESDGSKEGKNGSSQDFRLAQVDQGGTSNNSSVAQPDSKSQENLIGGAQLDEIVVTAQKRKEDARTIPLSISVLSGTALADRHIEDFADLSRAIPGLSFTNPGGPGLSNLEIRGISSQAGGSTVAIYLDETPITTANIQPIAVGAAEPVMLDIERVEILRGPQGTLYGSSSMGGTIRFISVQPDLSHFDAYASSDLSVTRHGGFNYTVSSAANLPLVAGVSAIRVAAQYGESDGYINQLSQTGSPVASRVNNQIEAAFRSTWAIEPTDALRIVPAFYFQRTTAGDTSIFFPSVGPFDEEKYVKEPLRDVLELPTLTVSYNAGDVDLSSISSFLVRDFQHVQDGTAENSQYLASVAAAAPPAGFGFGYNALANLPSPVYTRTTVRQWSQEFRIASNAIDESDHRLSWVAGLYFSDQSSTYNENDVIPGFSDTFTGLYGVTPATYFGAPFPNDEVFSTSRTFAERQDAAFADATFKLTNALRLSAGVRYLIAREAADLETGDYFGGSSISAVDHEHAATPRFAITDIIDSDTTLYANAGKGYRLGGPNHSIPQSLCGGDLGNIGLTTAPAAYGPDSLWNYEVGAKLRFLDNRISVDVDEFYIKWNDIQQSVFLPTCAFFLTLNTGHARSYGTELSVRAAATSNLTLSLAGGSTNATLTDNIKSLDVTAGTHVLGVPEWNADVGADLHAEVDNIGKAFLRIDYALTGPSNGTFDPTQPDYRRPEYQLLNLSAGVERGTLKYSVYVKNALNDDKAIQHINNNGIIEALALQPFTVGVSIRKAFGGLSGGQ
jgi:iron complex outermembrane recepter protein